MHAYADLDVDHDPFPPPVPYDAACCACEKQVLIDTEEKRQGVLVEGGLYYDKRKRSGGRKLAFDVGWLQGTDGRSLKAGDRLHPNHDLIDVGDFGTRVLPMTVVFLACGRRAWLRNRARLRAVAEPTAQPLSRSASHLMY